MPAYLVRCCCLGNQTAEVKAVLAALVQLDIQAVDGEAAISAGPGIVFFDQLTPQVFQVVSQLAQHGYERVLAVAERGCPLAGGAPWELLRAGASDALAWDQMADPLESIVTRVQRWIEVDELLSSPLVQRTLAGHNRVWRSVLREVVEIARYSDASVLITGHSGTGKELIARLIHELDRRPGKGQLVVLDCTTVAPELSGSEFFGHERGAFTGAISSRDGAFALADGGTLFLDEVGELPLRLQAELLRVVQERTYKRVGSSAWRQVSFRLVCATNRDLSQERVRGTFRDDFYHRLASWRCHLPPLSQRRGDILPLVAHFLTALYGDRAPPELDPAVRDFLLLRDYPGNVRELMQLVTRIAHRHVGTGPFTLGDLPADELARAIPGTESWPDPEFEAAIRGALALGKGLNDIRNAAAETAYRIVLDDQNGDTARAAERLKVSPRAVQQHLHSKSYGSASGGETGGPGGGRVPT